MVRMVVCNSPMNMLKVLICFWVGLSVLQNVISILDFFVFCYIISQSHVDGVADTDLVLLVTTRPTTGNTLAWAVACERDQWGRAIAGAFLQPYLLEVNEVCLLFQLKLFFYDL